MAKKERFGKFVLLEELESAAWGSEFRAAKLGPGGLEKIVSLLRLGPAVSNNSEIAKALMEQTKLAAQLQSPNVLKILGIGKVEGTYYISHEFVEGKSLRAIFHRCRQEGFPLSVDHALLIASKVCSALEYAHGRKIEGQGRFCHGLLTPANVIVSYEGELRVSGFGYWQARVTDAGAVSDEDLRYLAPEQLAGRSLDTRSDIYAVGALLFEGLTGEPLFPNGRQPDAAGRLSQARLQNPTTEDDALPRPIVDILARALATDPGDRYAEVQEMRKALDTLLFSGDFTPTTFNLAFFMHSLFRDDIERESKALKQEREASYFEYIQDEASQAAPSPAPVASAPTPAPTVSAPSPVPMAPEPAAPPEPVEQQPTTVIPAAVPPQPRSFTPVPPAAATHTPVPVASPPEHGSVADLLPPSLTPPPKAVRGHVPSLDHSGPILSHADEKKSGGRLGVILGALAATVIIGGGAYYFLVMKAPAAPSAPATPDPQVQAILEQNRKLEEQIQAIEREKAQAMAEAEEAAKAKLEEEARRQKRQVDAETLRRAQAEAAAKAAEEQERKAREERERIAAEQARLEQERLEAEKRAEQERQRQLAQQKTPTPAPTPPPTPTPPQIYAADAPGVIPPTRQCPKQPYPAAAKAMKVEGSVGLFVTVDEKGALMTVRALSGPETLRTAAVEHVKSCKFRPGTKDGTPVKVNWVFAIRYDL